jgi:acetyl/propionyl-CoA carboxylase alpha subunit
LWAEIGVSSSETNAKKGILLEVNIPRPLHWEVQLLGDGDTVVHLAARDCSLQNHGFQKFIELALYPEAIAREIQALHPEEAPGRIATLRQRQAVLERICREALRLGSALHLSGVATVEFLIDEQGTAYFLEVNPRIQVEHAVTECITRVHGQPISLVELQHRVAAGERLNFHQPDIAFVGDAIEVRLNAWHEDLSPVQGGIIHALHLDVPRELRTHVRVDAGGLLQRRDSWLIPGYDANFALLVVAGSNRRETLARMTGLLDVHLQIEGDGALHTNLEPVVGLLTLMQALPPATEFRTDTSLLWMALTAVIMAQKQEVLSLVPTFPRHLELHDPARHTRLLRTMLEKAFVHPSRLLTYYLRRLMASAPRPLSTLEVLLALAEELGVEIFEEEQQQWRVLHEATAALWTALSASHERYAALVHAAAAENLEQSADYEELYVSLQAVHPGIEWQESVQLLRYLLGWLSIEIPAVTALIRAIESTQLHACLAVPQDHDLSLPYPPFLKDEAVIGRLHHLLTAHLRPVVLRHDELLSPMEATIFLRPEPHAPPFVQIGSEIRAGQPLALLEAMKMFTEVTSPIDGILEDILVEDGHGVKTGTPLFKIAARDTSVDTMDDTMQELIDRAFRNYFGALFPFRDSADISHRLNASCPIS